MSEKNKRTHADLKILSKLFFTMLYISSFTFGGGFVIISFMKKKFVDEYHWIGEDEMLDMTALAQSSPGAIAVNAGILVGWKMGGLPGMAVAVLGTVLPPILILSAVSFFYAVFAENPYVAFVLKGMQAGVAAVILDVVCSLGGSVLKNKNIIQLLIMAASFTAVCVFHVNVIYIILAAALIGVGIELSGMLKRRVGR